MVVKDQTTSGGGCGGTVKVLGVIGGIASGKSTACDLLVDPLGCYERIDADKLGHLVYTPGSDALNEIVNEFGPSLLTTGDELNRKALGAIVFADPKAMKKLEAIVWPHVRTLAMNQLEDIRMKQQQKEDEGEVVVVVLEAAILLDAGWDDMCDAVWAVRVSPEVAQERLMKRNGLTETEAMTRIQAQKSCRGIGNLEDEYSSGTVHAIIENDGTLDQLQHTLQTTLTSFRQQPS